MPTFSANEIRTFLVLILKLFLVKFLKSNMYFNRLIEFQRASMWKTSPVEEHGVPVTRKNLHHHSRLLEVSIGYIWKKKSYFSPFFFCIFSQINWVKLAEMHGFFEFDICVRFSKKCIEIRFQFIQPIILI